MMKTSPIHCCLLQTLSGYMFFLAIFSLQSFQNLFRSALYLTSSFVGHQQPHSQSLQFLSFPNQMPMLDSYLNSASVCLPAFDWLISSVCFIVYVNTVAHLINLIKVKVNLV